MDEKYNLLDIFSRIELIYWICICREKYDLVYIDSILYIFLLECGYCYIVYKFMYKIKILYIVGIIMLCRK